MTLGAENKNRKNIIRGEFFVTDDAKLSVTTILGSCIAACIRDPGAGVGGINHFLLPGPEEGATGGADVRMGVHLMELLVNGLLKAGARRDRLEAKLFGGARAVKGLSDIGELNTQFAERFLRREGIVFVAGSTGGDCSRRIEYWPVSGRARQVLLTTQDIVPTPPPKIVLPIASNAGELELF